MSQVSVLLAVCFTLFLLEMSSSTPCSGLECSFVIQPRLRRSGGPYKRRDEYDFVRFGKRSEAQKKAGYDYVRFGKRNYLPKWNI